MDKIKASQTVRDFLKKIASQGGTNRNKNLTVERKREIAMMGVSARNKNRKK